MQQVTLGLSLHRPEMIPIISRHMRAHEAIILEEPPAPDFGNLLCGDVSIDDYLLTLDVEYPEFSRSMYQLLRELHQEILAYRGGEWIDVDADLEEMRKERAYELTGLR